MPERISLRERISPYSVRMRENTDQNNSENGHSLRSVMYFWGMQVFNAIWTFFGFILRSSLNVDMGQSIQEWYK